MRPGKSTAFSGPHAVSDSAVLLLLIVLIVFVFLVVLIILIVLVVLIILVVLIVLLVVHNLPPFIRRYRHERCTSRQE